MAEKIRLSGVPETMPQTVYACAKESRGRGAVQDKTAEALIRQLDYDFSLAVGDAAMYNGVIARTIVLDRLTGTWLAENSGAVVVTIACGLDTQCNRMSAAGRRSQPRPPHRGCVLRDRLSVSRSGSYGGYPRSRHMSRPFRIPRSCR